jgi:hypothetical protein
MQAIELNVVISDNHEIHLKLPDDVTATRAKVIVIYENDPKNQEPALLSEQALAEDWLKAEEELAWAHLQLDK